MSYKDDYRRAVFLNAYGNGKPIRENNEYSRYFEFECGITNPRKYHKDLIKAGYLQQSPTKDVISSLKVTELKEICDSLGISKAGKKLDLINRIISFCPAEQIYSFAEEQLYSLSEKGSSFVREHEDYIQLHKHKNWGIGLDEYIDFKQSLPFNGSFRDISWGIFNNRIIEYAKEYGLLRNNYLNMSYLMKEESEYGEELKYLLYVLFLDICGADTVRHLEYCDTKDEALKDYDCFVFRTVIPNEIAHLKGYYNESYVDWIYTQNKRLPMNLCDVATFKQLISDIFNGIENLQEKYEKIFYGNYQKYIDDYFAMNPLSERQKYEARIDFLDKGGTRKELERLQNDKKSSENTQKSGGCLTSMLMCCLFIFSIISFLI